MSRFFAHWFVVTVALGVTAWILPGVHVLSLVALLVGGLVLGLVNALVRPLLVWLTLPITVLTLGLFYLVINGLSFACAAWLVPGFTVDNFGSAVLGALLVSVVSWFAGQFVREEPPTTHHRDAAAH